MKQYVITKLRQAHTSAPLEFASRLGYVTNGMFHFLLAIAIIAIALGRPREADASGVLTPFSHTWYGALLLILIFCGLFSLGIWHLLGIALARKNKRRNDWKFFVSHIARAVAYMVFALTTVAALVGGESTKSSATESVNLTSRALLLPLGAGIVYAIAVVTALIGVIFLYRGISKKFLISVKLPGTTAGTIITILGVAGYMSKGLLLLLVAYIFFAAGATHNPDQASGLDGAIKVILTVPMGRIMVILLGIGLVAYAFYSVARGRYSKQQLN
jgi:hypothetical protein